MPILPQIPQIVLSWIHLYWLVLAELFSNYFYADLLHRCRKHLLVRLAAVLDFSPLEQACAGYHHHQGPGRLATYPVAVLVRCLLVGHLDQLSSRQLEHRLASDLLVRWFVGLAAFGETPDHSTLVRFEQWVWQHQPDVYFQTVLAQVDRHFPTSRHALQIGDSYGMWANAAEEELLPRIRHTVRKLLAAAVEEMPCLLSPTVSGFAWDELFGAPQEGSSFGLPEDQKQQRLIVSLLAAQELQVRFSDTLQNGSSSAFPQLRRWLAYLSKILHDEVLYSPDGVHLRTSRARRKDPQATFRIISATDPDASYRLHGETRRDLIFGYNIQVAASSDGFIRATQAYPGASPDQVGIAELITAQKEYTACCPPKLVYDQAAGIGKIHAQVAAASDGQTQLVAKLMPYDQRSSRFSPYDFQLSQDQCTLTCPAGQSSTIAYPSHSGEGRTFRFFARQCWQNHTPPKRWHTADLDQRCPLWEQCRDSRQGPGSMRQVFISDYRQQVIAAQVYNQSTAFQHEIKQRYLIERIIFELTHYHGARHARRRGLTTAAWQAKMSATTYNLKLWLRKLARSAKPPWLESAC